MTAKHTSLFYIYIHSIVVGSVENSLLIAKTTIFPLNTIEFNESSPIAE